MSSDQTVLYDVPGAKARVRHRLYGAASIVVALLVLWWVLTKFADKNQLEAAKWSPFLDWVTWKEYLLIGLRQTLIAAVISIVFAAVLGLLLGLGRMSQIRLIRWPCAVFVEFFRAVPVLLMMYFTFRLYNQYGLFSDDLRALAAVVTGLTFYNASVMGEVLRAGVASLPAGQREAGLSIGLRPPQVLRAILVPQALTAMMPILVSQLVIVLKDTALGSAILYDELLNWGQTLGSAQANTVPVLIVVAVIFILLNYALTKVAGRLERRLRRRGASKGVDAEGTGLGAEVTGPDMRYNTQTGL
ncbi:amino acid ABC transporter permease [Segeticoccus rhizosphaerae]|jgi:glutamate transport system permease protein|uniref:amino acid ABC transporter permease n=1 Tax=Segeticoccus rhizosphaerae TaxID=1104777 RepID=UPI0010C07F7C|nr:MULTISPECIES: amino acid ABC transporter permease [Intrasporangiaceae]